MRPVLSSTRRHRSFPWPVLVFALLLSSVVLVGSPAVADDTSGSSPCQESLDFLRDAYEADPATRVAFQSTLEGLKPLPAGYMYDGTNRNPWSQYADGEALMHGVVDFYRKVCTTLPQIIGTNDNALDSIQYFAWIYYQNPAGQRMVKGIDPNDPDRELRSVQDFLILFNKEYLRYMNSPPSARVVPEWVADPRIEIGDYVPTDYTNWNQFFARELKQGPDGGYPSRPVTMPERDYVIVAPTDCIMNPLVQVVDVAGDPQRLLLENPLQQDTVLDVKNIPVSVADLLADAPPELKAKFNGGTGLACVLMPNTYHHFHSPVDGEVVYSQIVEAGTPHAWGTFGYVDWPNWVPLDGNVGRPGTDFSQFEGFQRGVIIQQVWYDNLPGLPPDQPKKLSGYVASIPVGLDTVGSVVFTEHAEKGKWAKKGVTEFGNFYFGGSLDILLFSPIEGFDHKQMVSPAVQVRMGNQIGILNTPYDPPPTPWTPGAGHPRARTVKRWSGQP